jgi:hypothetical protein
VTIAPYRRWPEPPLVGMLVRFDEALFEDGSRSHPSEAPAGSRVYASPEHVRYLVSHEHGQALEWNLQPIRWRPEVEPGEWKNRASDVRVLGVPFPARIPAVLDGLVAWRDWLADYRAAPASSLGGSGLSLLRATLERPLWTAAGELPPIPWTLGGRVTLGPQGAPLRLDGVLRHYDLPAAYAETLGRLRYGGVWIRVDPLRYPFERTAERGELVFCRARVKVPDLVFGPLPRRPRRRPDPTSIEYALGLSRAEYPTSTTLTGVWTFDEVKVAIEAGCTVQKMLDVWIHSTGPRTPEPFRPWWEAIQAGRRMQGFAGVLAKTTGNALFGQFIVSHGRKDAVHYPPRGRRRYGLPERRPQPVQTGPPRAYDLGEQITGQVRAKLARFLDRFGGKVVCAHTDGAWIDEPREVRPKGWRQDERAERIDVLSPQFLRYWQPGADEPSFVVSGVPEDEAPATFERLWKLGKAVAFP